MLLVVPAVRRRCSVRSVATAAKPQPNPAPATDLLHADRAAVLARSKWAKPKSPNKNSAQAGPSKSEGPSPFPPFKPDSIASSWGAASASKAAPTVETTPAGRLAATSKWARPIPAPNPTPPTPKVVARPMPNNEPKATQKNSPRTRWPSLMSEPVASPDYRSFESEDYASAFARNRPPWPAESQRVIPAENTRPSLAKQWALPQASQSLDLPSHFRWKPPEVSTSPAPASSPSTPPLDSPSTAPLHSAMDKILPPSPKNNNINASPDPRLQRQVAPHLDPQVLRSTHSQPHVSPAAKVSPPSPITTSEHLRVSQLAQPPLAKASAGATEKNSRPKNAFKERGSLLKTDARQPVLQPKSNAPKVKKAWAYVEKRVTEDVYIPSTVSVEHLSRLLSVRLEDLQDKMYQAGMGAQASFDYVLTADYAVLLAEELGRKPTVNDEAAFDLYPPPPHADSSVLPTRPPVVTIMGHVDHGKTTLLDTLRSSSVAKGEVGGITQHIGAFSVPVPSAAGAGPQSITFLDTPGHAAFSAMRARGAQVTDIIVLVVAADDGIMPQTREVIELIKKDRDNVGVVVAINKIDKPGCDVDALQKALLVEDIHLEDLGGDTPSVEVSGLTGQGLPELVETLSLMAEIQDLRAEPDGAVFGYVLESKVLKGLGAIATVLVLRGCLKPGSHILSGVHHAKVRIMQDSNGKPVKAASPGMAVTVSGWKSLPNAGDEVLQGTESEIKKAIANRQRKADIEASLLDIEAINSSRQQERERRQAEAETEQAGEEAQPKLKEETPTGPKELRLLIKADVSGSAEAVEGALQGIGNHLAITKVVSSGVGDVLESDVMMAKAVGGMIVGFSVSSSRTVETLAAQHGVPIVTNDIIYRLMEDIKARVIKLLPVILESKVIGEAKVLQLFEIQVKGKQTKTVAGSRIINGFVEKNKPARVVRDGTVVFEGSFETMRHFKKDVTELRKGTECGLNLAGFDDLQVDDVIQTYETIEKPGLL